MKNLNKLIALLLLLTISVSVLFGCDGNDPDKDNTPPTTDDGGNDGGTDDGKDDGEDTPAPFVDYVSQIKLDLNSNRARTTAQVVYDMRDKDGDGVKEKVFTGCVDGDTTHFNVPSITDENGNVITFLKARYIAINTPESTGQVEPWGKAASNFVKERLSKATDIILESDTNKWNLDSTGGRYLVWVWYKTAEMTDYRCLNLEIMQAGLCIASGYSDYVYADWCRIIYAQAMAHKLCVHNKNEKDPDFYYGAAFTLTLKELKVNIEDYVGKDVSFEGVVVRKAGSTLYVEEYDEETGEYFGIQVYTGFNLGIFGEEIVQVGNRVLFAGNVQYYEAGDTYQLSDIKYNAYYPDHDDNIRLVSQGHSASYDEVSAKTLTSGKLGVTITEVDENDNETTRVEMFDYGFLTMHSTKTLKNLTVQSVWTTDNDGKSDGAHSITCTAEDGTTVVLRTVPLYDASGNLIPKSYFEGEVIESAKGVVDSYNGTYQLKIFSLDDVIFR